MLPRILAVILLLISLVMLVPIGSAATAMARGADVPPAIWGVPLAILATGAALTWILSRTQVSLNLYLAAFALWVVTAGYFFVRFVM